MADKPNAYRVRQPRTGKDLPKAGRNTREKVTAVGLPRDDRAFQGDNPDLLEPAPEWSVENVPSEVAAVNYTPALGEARVIPARYYPPPRGAEAAIVSALVSLARFARRKPGTSLVFAATAGLAAGIGMRRI